MSTNPGKLNTIIYLYVIILMCISGCTLLNKEQVSMEPIRRLRITIDINQRQDLFDQLQKFSDKHSFRFVLSDYGTTKYFLVEMWGDNILITAAAVPGDSSQVSINFSGPYPGYQVDEQVVDELLSDLKDYINEIPNVTITEKK